MISKRKNSIKIWATDELIPILYMEITNGIVTVSIGLYDNLDRLKEFGRELANYPLHPSIGRKVKATLLYRKSSRVHRLSHYFDRFTIDVYHYKTNGDPAITVNFKGQTGEPTGNMAQFCIKTRSADIVELGGNLIQWNPELENEFLWENIIGSATNLKIRQCNKLGASKAIFCDKCGIS